MAKKKKLSSKEIRKLKNKSKTKIIEEKKKKINLDIVREEIDEKKNVTEKSKADATLAKSKNKAVGVKSVFEIGDGKQIVSSFGNGEKAIIEYKLDEQYIYKISETPKILVEPKKEKGYYVKSSRIKDMEGNIPEVKTEVRQDLLGLKCEIENEVFGDSFNDNIRVQIGYAIFDIIKYLATTSAQIVYTVNSLNRHDNLNTDIIGGVLNYNIPYCSFGVVSPESSIKNAGSVERKRKLFIDYYKNAKENFIYFNDIFCDFVNETDGETENNKSSEYHHAGKVRKVYRPKSEEEVYNILSCINFLRNNISHFAFRDNNVFQESYSEIKTICGTINSAFSNAIKIVNDNFKNEDNNLYLFAKAVAANEDEYPTLAEMIYKNNILNMDKNIGFKLKKVREIAFDKGYVDHEFNVQTLSSFRSKLNKIIDLTLMYYFRDCEISALNEDLVDSLRATIREEDKEKVYCDYTKSLFSNDKIKQAIRRIISAFNEKKYIAKRNGKNKSNVIEIKQSYLEDIEIKNNVSDFSKLIYFVSRFLSGKEINILFNTLIHKLKVIESFNEVISDIKNIEGISIKQHKYKKEYAIFVNSGKIADELSMIKNISKMNKAYDNNFIERLEKDVLLTLGVEAGSLNDVYRDLLIDNEKTGLKNFLRNNIIKSGRLAYVVKYIKPSDVNLIMKNKSIVSYVLSRMSDDQIIKYYKGIVSSNGIPTATFMRGKVLDKLLKIDYQMLSKINVNGENKPSLNENIEKERLKSLFSLYYTVAYIFVKNMVNINARYLLGFYFLERDKVLFSQKFGTSNRYYVFNSKKAYDGLTRIFTEMSRNFKHKKLSNKSCIKMKRYIDNKNYDIMYRKYRNFIEHLNILSAMSNYINNDLEIDSYFGFFHYVVQIEVYSELNNWLSKIENNIPKKNMKKNLKKNINHMEKITKCDNSHFLDNKQYSKALLRAMNVPFGYNLARYKNLSYEKYFSMQQK